MRAILVAWGALLALALCIGCGDDSNPPPPSFGDTCTVDVDCKSGLVCKAPVLVGKTCTNVCRSSGDCPDGASCWDAGYCL